MLRRHPNYIWDQLGEDRMLGQPDCRRPAPAAGGRENIPPRKSPRRTLLVSDVSGLGRLPPGRYTSSGCELEILADGRLVIAGQDQLLAGRACRSAPVSPT